MTGDDANADAVTQHAANLPWELLSRLAQFRDKHLPRALMFFSPEGIKGSTAAPTESRGLNCHSCREEHWRRQWLHLTCNTFRAAFKNVLKLGSEDLSTMKSVHHLPVFQTPLVQCCIVWETRVLIQSLGFGVHDPLGLEDASVMFAGCSFMGQLSTKPSCWVIVIGPVVCELLAF